MARLLNRDRQMLKSDISFGLMGMIGTFGLVMDSFQLNPIISSAPQPWMTAGVALVLTIVIAFVVTKVAKIDRSRSEEYTFQILSSAAVVSIITTMFITLVWTSDFLLSRWTGSPTPGQIIATLMASWSLGYFTFRIRGVGE
jgi:uncharacterized membrane protein